MVYACIDLSLQFRCVLYCYKPIALPNLVNMYRYSYLKLQLSQLSVP